MTGTPDIRVVVRQGDFLADGPLTVEFYTYGCRCRRRHSLTISVPGRENIQAAEYVRHIMSAAGDLVADGVKYCTVEPPE